MLTTFSWVPKGGMKATPILSTDSADRARQKLRDQHPEYVEEQVPAPNAGLPHGATAAPTGAEEDYADSDADETLRAVAGGGAGAIVEQIESDDEEEIADTTFKPTDLVFAVAAADPQAPRLELYIYDEPEDNMYVHHDMEISAFPLCSSWLTDGTMSMLAVGTMLPFIEIWALDVMDSVEPAILLGGCAQVEHNYSKKAIRRHLKPDSHQDAVLSVRWNTVAQNIIASGSADATMKLWDLNQGGVCLGTYTEAEKVQSLDWHHTDANLLLSGDFGASVVLRDCRQPNQPALRFQMPDVVEHVEFVASQAANNGSMTIMASTSNGYWACFDGRAASSNGSGGASSTAALWQLQPHQSDTTFHCSRQVPGLYATGGKDGQITLWDGRRGNQPPTAIVSRDYKTGAVLSLAFHPNSPHILGACGARGEPLVYTITSDIQDIFQ